MTDVFGQAKLNGSKPIPRLTAKVRTTIKGQESASGMRCVLRPKPIKSPRLYEGCVIALVSAFSQKPGRDAGYQSCETAETRTATILAIEGTGATVSVVWHELISSCDSRHLEGQRWRCNP